MLRYFCHYNAVWNVTEALWRIILLIPLTILGVDDQGHPKVNKKCIGQYLFFKKFHENIQEYY